MSAPFLVVHGAVIWKLLLVALTGAVLALVALVRRHSTRRAVTAKLNYLERRDIASLRVLPDQIRKANGANAPSPQVAAMIDLINLAIAALEGDPEPYLARLEADVAEDMADDQAGRPSREGRGIADMMWMHAIEFAAAGDASMRTVETRFSLSSDIRSEFRTQFPLPSAGRILVEASCESPSAPAGRGRACYGAGAIVH